MKHDKRLLVDVFNAYYYKKNAQGKRDLVFMSKNLTVGGIVNSQETTDVRNGQGNKVFAILPGQKDVTINLTENVFSFEALQVNTGSDVKTGDATVITDVITYKPETLVGLPDNQILLPHKPINPEELVIYIDDTKIEYEGTQDNTAQPTTPTQFKFNTAGGANGGIILHDDAVDLLDVAVTKIFPYLYTVADKAETLTVKASEFATGGELWLETLEKDTNQKAVNKVFFVFENAFPDGNFELNTQSEVQPVDMSVNMRAIANDEDELYKIIRVPVIHG